MGRIFPRSTKPAPPFLNLSVRTAQPCSSPVAYCAPPHPLQNRVPRGECVPVARKLRADRAGRRDQVLLPLPKCVSPDLAKTAWSGDFSYLSWSGYGLVFRAYVASGAVLSHPSVTGFYRSHPLQHPKRTRFRPFWPKPGAFFSFSLFSGCKIFVLVFVHFVA